MHRLSRLNLGIGLRWFTSAASLRFWGALAYSFRLSVLRQLGDLLHCSLLYFQPISIRRFIVFLLVDFPIILYCIGSDCRFKRFSLLGPGGIPENQRSNLEHLALPLKLNRWLTISS